ALAQAGAGLEPEPSDFTDTRPRSTFEAVGGDLKSAKAVDVSQIADEGVRTDGKSLGLDDRRLPSVEDLAALLRRRRLDTRIEELNEKLATLDPSGQAYSEVFRELIALQQERRSSTP